MPKIVLIGVGSVCFGAGTIGDLMYFRNDLAGSTIGLVDTDAEKLELMKNLADTMNRDAGLPFKIEASMERREVLPGADFVVTSPAIKREELWKRDWDILKAAGIKQTYGENGGPGSLFLTLRNVPLLLSIFKDVEELAPHATVINFTNPEARICMAIDRYTSLKFAGLCHGIHNAYGTVEYILGIPREDLDIKAAGINHFTWIYDVRRKSTGLDIYDDFRSKLSTMPDDFEPISRRLYNAYGMYPTIGDHHLAEFISFGWEFQGLHGRDFVKQMAEKTELLEWLRGVKAGTRHIEEHVQGRTSESIADIVLAMTKGLNHYEISLDIRNNGCIPNLPEDAIVEVPGVVSGDGVRGLKMSPLPEGIAIMARQQVAVQGLSVEAAVKGDKKLALQAMLLDPVVDNYSVCEKVLDKLLDADRENISPEFFR